MDDYREEVGPGGIPNEREIATNRLVDEMSKHICSLSNEDREEFYWIMFNLLGSQGEFDSVKFMDAIGIAVVPSGLMHGIMAFIAGGCAFRWQTGWFEEHPMPAWMESIRDKARKLGLQTRYDTGE